MKIKNNWLLVLIFLGCTVGACKDEPVPAEGTDAPRPQQNNNTDQNSDNNSTCRDDDSCADGQYCDGDCFDKKRLGEKCANDNMCQSGFCAGGFCCESACLDKTKSCGVSGSLGYCVCRGHFSGDNCEKCENGYFGQNCDRRIFCEHGIVNDGPEGDGHCKSCNDGWSGRDCDLPKTCQNGTANLGLTGNGQCLSCQSGWVGPNCDIPNNCLYGHIATADIESDGSCTCDNGYEGKNCEKQAAACKVVNATGVDQITGSCTGCKIPYYGENCDQKAYCNVDNTVSVDQNSGACSCVGGFFGKNCEKTIYCQVENTTTGSFNQETGYCNSGSCKVPYYGDDCKQNSGCDITGSFSVTDKGACNCQSAYTGTKCNNKITCVISNLRSSGYVLSDGHCSGCKVPYYGDNCDKVSKCNPNTTSYVAQSTGKCYCKSDYKGTYCQRYGDYISHLYLNDLIWGNYYQNDDYNYAENEIYNTTTEIYYFPHSDAVTVCEKNDWRLPTVDEVGALFSKYCTAKYSYSDGYVGCRKDLVDLGFNFEKAGYLTPNGTLTQTGGDYFWLAGSSLNYFKVDDEGDADKTYFGTYSYSPYLPVMCVKDDN